MGPSRAARRFSLLPVSRPELHLETALGGFFFSEPLLELRRPELAGDDGLRAGLGDDVRALREGIVELDAVTASDSMGCAAVAEQEVLRRPLKLPVARTRWGFAAGARLSMR